MAKDHLADYVEVNERILQFKEAFPDGSLRRDEWHIETIGDKTFIVYTALAFRDQRDTKPGVGTAWEPFPGTTNFTRNSELMNAETSAWGRAVVALGFVGKKQPGKKAPPLASREEVQNRSAESNGKPPVPKGPPAAPEELDAIRAALKGVPAPQVQLHLGSVGVTDATDVKEAVANLTQPQAHTLIEKLAEKAAA